jgi:DNA-binding transcriptional regulator YdaS (Cro superfamily)
MAQNIRGLTFQELIRDLALRYHRGRFLPMASRIGVSSALVDQWKRGIVRRPSLHRPPRCSGLFA